VLWRVVLVCALLALWVAFLRRDSNGDTIAFVSGILVVVSLLSAQLLRQKYYAPAVWMFIGGMIVATALPMGTGNINAIHVAPFTFSILVFLMGLLLPPGHTFLALGLTIALTLGVPFGVTGGWDFFSVYTVGALGLSLTAALLAVQVTGELYQITDWALLNYQRERRTSIDLFENRQQLEKTLRRSTVLGEKLQQINSELENAKHFRGQFLANMSHELRTPLNAIIGFSETMLSFPIMYDEVELPDAYRRDLEQIRESGTQLLTVINDILDLSKVDAGRLEVDLRRTNLEPIVDSAMMTAAGLVAKKRIELKRDLPYPLPLVYADETRLRQVLLNLYSNAAKFTDQGSITIRVADRDDMGAGAHHLEELDQVLDIFVEAEAAVPDADIAGIGPVGDVDVMVGQQDPHGIAQKRREMP
jgi:signal transduction histidine kinase